MQVSMYAEYNKGLLNIERIQLFLPTPFCKDRNTGHLIICFFFLATFTTKVTDCAEIQQI